MKTKVKYLNKKLKEIAKKYLLVGFVLVILIITGFVLDRFFPIKSTQSAATDNVSGWAWSETIGWISFNCTDRGICGTSNYGVNVNSSTGDFSGYAWSENIGWISFNRADAGNPPAVPYNGGSGPIANFDFATKRVRGWAKALTADGNGWDGWIKLGDGGTWPGGGSPPSLDSQVYVQIQAGPDELRGWAWGSDVVGWISFNCADRPGNLCATSNYKVLLDINFPPTVTTSDIATCVLPGWNCCTDSRHPPFSWNYSDPDGDLQASYRLQVDDNSDFLSPVLDTQIIDSGSWTYTWKISDMIPSGSNFVWNTKYYWRIKVKDTRGAWSVPEWSNISNLTLPLHAYPDVDFNRSPQNPSAGENVVFTDGSKCYDDVGTDQCTKPNDSFSWTFTPVPPNTGTIIWDLDDGNVLIEEELIVSFSNKGEWDVKLEVTDSAPSNYKCSAVKSVKVSLPLPEWKEIIPR